MNKCLILLTNYYPYYKGEEYLESEITYLSDRFKKIILVPTMVNETMEQTRNVPNNVEILNINYHHSLQNKIISTLKPSKNKMRSQQINYTCKLYQNYFNNRSNHVFDLLKNNISNFDFQEYSGIVIYSYWLYITAQVGILLKDYLSQNNTIPIKIISRAHRYDLYENESRLKFLPSREYLLENLDCVYPCSDDGTNYLKKCYPKYSQKISTQRLGTQYMGTNNLSNNDVFQIVSCSTLRPVKRVDLIIDALQELEKKNIKYFWTHFGDGEELEKLQEKAAKKLTTTNYNFYGFISNKVLMKFYNTKPVNCFINVSKSEGIPVSIMEAMSFSIPVIATDVGGTKEVVINKENGFLVGKNVNAEELSNKIQYMINNKKIYDMFKVNSYAIWDSKVNSTKNYSDFVTLISTS